MLFRPGQRLGRWLRNSLPPPMSKSMVLSSITRVLRIWFVWMQFTAGPAGAHAGATGDRAASVSALHLAPTQLRIADLVTRAPEDEEDGRGPEVARIKDDQLMVEAAGTSGWRSKAR